MPRKPHIRFVLSCNISKPSLIVEENGTTFSANAIAKKVKSRRAVLFY